jgi:hypothetical protein
MLIELNIVDNIIIFITRKEQFSPEIWKKHSPVWSNERLQSDFWATFYILFVQTGISSLKCSWLISHLKQVTPTRLYYLNPIDFGSHRYWLNRYHTVHLQTKLSPCSPCQAWIWVIIDNITVSEMPDCIWFILEFPLCCKKVAKPLRMEQPVV